MIFFSMKNQKFKKRKKMWNKHQLLRFFFNVSLKVMVCKHVKPNTIWNICRVVEKGGKLSAIQFERQWFHSYCLYLTNKTLYSNSTKGNVRLLSTVICFSWLYDFFFYAVSSMFSVLWNGIMFLRPKSWAKEIERF